MLDIKALKKQAKRNLKLNYFAMVAVCFVMALLMSEYASAGALFSQDVGNPRVSALEKFAYGESVTPASIIDDYAEQLFHVDVIDEHNITATQGVMATMVNGFVRSADFMKYVVLALENFLSDHKYLEGLFALLLVATSLAYVIFVRNLFIVGERRFFLENKCYHDTQVRRILFLYTEKKITNPAKIMIMKSVFNWLWAITIVGGVYKYYEYRMIRYILAENPDIDMKSCFALSKQMMMGNKMRMFILDLSFIPWYVISFITLGVVSWAFVNPYYTATESEVYFTLREQAVSSKYDGYELLIDDYLVNEPEERTKDIYPSLEIKMGHGYLTHWNVHYPLVNLGLLFISFMFIGWVWEVFYTFMLHGVLVNRGSLHGPWLPIYGIGGLMIVILFKKLGDKPQLLFITAFIACGIMEYATGWYFDNVKGLKYWDYSNYFLNINGYVCFEGLLMFAVLASFGFYIIAPYMNNKFNKIPIGYRNTAVAILLPLFCIDVVYSHFIPNEGEGVGGSDYKQ